MTTNWRLHPVIPRDPKYPAYQSSPDELLSQIPRLYATEKQGDPLARAAVPPVEELPSECDVGALLPSTLLSDSHVEVVGKATKSAIERIRFGVAR